MDLANNVIDLAFKLYPWEFMFEDEFGSKLKNSTTRWIEPPWKAILSNKGILPLLWEMFPGHPNLLPAYFECEASVARIGDTYVRKPIYSREGANVSIIKCGSSVVINDGPYGGDGYVRQALAPLFSSGGQFAVIGSWLVEGIASGLSIREDESLVTGNRSRFIPHIIQP